MGGNNWIAAKGNHRIPLEGCVIWHLESIGNVLFDCWHIFVMGISSCWHFNIRKYRFLTYRPVATPRILGEVPSKLALSVWTRVRVTFLTVSRFPKTYEFLGSHVQVQGQGQGWGQGIMFELSYYNNIPKQYVFWISGGLGWPYYQLVLVLGLVLVWTITGWQTCMLQVLQCPQRKWKSRYPMHSEECNWQKSTSIWLTILHLPF